MLHKARKLRGSTVQGTDGPIGTVSDFLLDEGQWVVAYLVVTPSGSDESPISLPPSLVHRGWDSVDLPVRLTTAEARQLPAAKPAAGGQLRSAVEVWGYHVQALDGEIGHVDDVLIDHESWRVAYLEVDTSNWIGGRSVVISTNALHEIRQESRLVHVEISRDEVKRSPVLDSLDLAPGELAPPFAFI